MVLRSNTFGSKMAKMAQIFTNRFGPKRPKLRFCQVDRGVLGEGGAKTENMVARLVLVHFDASFGLLKWFGGQNNFRQKKSENGRNGGIFYK